jgi:hypothetical protein
MQHVREGYRGLSVIMGLNVDRILSVLAIFLTLLLASWIHSI